MRERRKCEFTPPQLRGQLFYHPCVHGGRGRTISVGVPVCHSCEDDVDNDDLVRSDRGRDPRAVLGVERIVDDGPGVEEKFVTSFVLKACMVQKASAKPWTILSSQCSHPYLSLDKLSRIRISSQYQHSTRPQMKSMIVSRLLPVVQLRHAGLVDGGERVLPPVLLHGKRLLPVHRFAVVDLVHPVFEVLPVRENRGNWSTFIFGDFTKVQG